MMVDWDKCRADFEWDGSWRDIYVHGTCLSDWDQLLGALPSWQCEIEFTGNGQSVSLPASSEAIFAQRAEHALLLRVNAAGILLNAHFYSPDEIEFDLDPREVQTARDMEALTTFMARLGDLLRKRVTLTPENGPEDPILEYDPAARETRYHEPQHGRRT